MKKRVIITSVFSGAMVKLSIVKFAPTDLILVAEKGIMTPKDKAQTTNSETIKNLRKEYGNILNIELLETNSVFELYNITKDIVSKIDSLKNSEILIHISEGTKALAFAMSYAAYLRKDKIEGLYYLNEELKNILKMPLLEIPVNSSQKNLLKILNSKEMKSSELLEKSELQKSVFYKYIKELKSKAYLESTDDLIRITELGKIALID